MSYTSECIIIIRMLLVHGPLFRDYMIYSNILLLIR